MPVSRRRVWGWRRWHRSIQRSSSRSGTKRRSIWSAGIASSTACRRCSIGWRSIASSSRRSAADARITAGGRRTVRYPEDAAMEHRRMEPRDTSGVWRAGRRAAGALVLQQVAGDDETLDLAGPFADGAELDVAVELFCGIVLDESVAAVDLHAFVGAADGDFAG